jgi:hypothetical protein
VSQNRYFARRFLVLVVFGVMVYGVVRVVGLITEDGSSAGGASIDTVPSAGGGSTSVAVPTPTSVAVTSVAAAATADPGGPPSADDPARILIVGDSDAGTFGPYLELLIDQSDVGEVVDVSLDYVVSSGLARPDFFDWPAKLESDLVELDPDIVIVTFGGNDAQGLSEPCADGAGTCSIEWVVGAPVGNEAEWTTEYRARVDRVLDLMLDGGRHVIWVGIPNAAAEEMTAGLEVQDQAVRAALDGRERVSFVDTWDMFDGGNGGYAEYVPDPRDGVAKPIRAADGFHLNTTGAEILALAIFDELEVVLADLGAPV